MFIKIPTLLSTELALLETIARKMISQFARTKGILGCLLLASQKIMGGQNRQ